MRNLKRVLSLALALVMVLGMMVITTSAATFADEDEITYKEAVEVMSAIGIIVGDNGYFNPTDTLTREGAAKILAFICLGAEADNYLTGSTDAPFTDVPADHWSAKYVTFCKNLKIIDGMGDGSFNRKGNISTVGFGKLVLGAVGIDGTYTGAGWENNVKAALEKAKLDVVTIDSSDITREEACELALAAMKYDATASGYVVKNALGNVVKTFDDLLDASVYANTLTSATGDTYTAAPATGTDNLLNKTYGVTTARSTDHFGRPGIRYTNAETKMDLFYADEALAKFEGPVAEKDLFAAAGIKNNDTSFTYTLIEDGSDAKGTFTADKEIKNVSNHAKWTAAGTGNGIKTELYKDIDDSYDLVAIREYMGTVTTVTDATEDDARSINVTLDILSTGYETTKVTLAYETEDFEEDDRVLVTVTWAAGGPKIQTIAAPETVKGAITKIAGDVYTIGGAEYVKAQNAYGVTLSMDGKEYEWYVDSFGNLISDVTAAGPGTPTYYYGVILAVDGVRYEPATGGLLTGTPVKEANEVIKIKTSAGEDVILQTAWKYEYNTTTGAVTKVDFINDDDQTAFDGSFTYSADVTAGTLIKYTLDKDGKVATIASATATPSAGAVTKGKAQIMNGATPWSGILADDTVVYMTNGVKYEVVTGYKNVPTKTFTNATYFGGSGATDGAFDAILLKGVDLGDTSSGDDYLAYFAGVGYTAEWDAENETTVYVYENVYIDGVKTALTFDTTQSVTAGYLYAYNTKTGLSGGNLLVGTDTVNSIQTDYFRAGTTISYVDADTVYYQVNGTAKTITAVEGLPAVRDYTTTVLKTVVNTDGVTTVVFFSAVEK